jgi:hypothetical protein
MTRAYRGGKAHGTTVRRDDADDWRDRAACGTASPSEQRDFTDGSVHPSNMAPLARKFCDHCPVRTECTAWAWTENAFMGVAGGYLWGFAAGRHYRHNPEYRRLVKL